MGPEQAIYRGAQCELKSRLGICGRKALIATIRSLSPVTTAMLDTKTAAEFFPDSSRTVRQHRSGSEVEVLRWGAVDSGGLWGNGRTKFVGAS